MNILAEYIKYRWIAKGRHGIHSPFVYELVDECLRKKVAKEDKNEVVKYIRQLKKDNSILAIQDFGAGSKRLSNRRKISKIARTNSSSGKYGKLLYQLAHYYSPKCVLEFGTSLGIGSLYLGLGNTSAKITTVEGCPSIYSYTKSKHPLSGRIDFINETFDSYLKELKSQQFDFIFIDGHHDGEALKRYINRLEPNLHENSIIIADDIRWSDGMSRAWNELIADERFHLSIDFFRMGLLSPRKSQAKEHFVLSH